MQKTSIKQEAGKRLLAMQKKTAYYLNGKVRHWSKVRKIIFLYALCGLFIAGIAINGILCYSVPKHTQPAIRTPPLPDSIIREYFLPQKK